jgi:hypothetical protein
MNKETKEALKLMLRDSLTGLAVGFGVGVIISLILFWFWPR